MQSSASKPKAGLRWAVRIAAGGMAILVLYMVGTFVQVWRASKRDGARPVQAIVVFGAAQYNGKPSPVLRARLEHATKLFKRGLARQVVVTGGRQPNDRFTEATVSANYLASKGIPQSSILREVSGRNSWESLASAAPFPEGARGHGGRAGIGRVSRHPHRRHGWRARPESSHLTRSRLADLRCREVPLHRQGDLGRGGGAGDRLPADQQREARSAKSANVTRCRSGVV